MFKNYTFIATVPMFKQLEDNGYVVREGLNHNLINLLPDPTRIVPINSQKTDIVFALVPKNKTKEYGANV